MGVQCYLRAVGVFYGSTVQSNADLVALNPTWCADTIAAKVGIQQRRVASPGETAVDLAERAARDALQRSGYQANAIDALILVTESPDFLLPSSACILQHLLGLPTSVAAFDVGLGCSGFNYGLWLARSFVLAGQANRVLLVCAETYSRYCDPHDLGTVTLFGDGAAAVILQSSSERALATIGESMLGTDGSGAEDLIVRQGGGRSRANAGPANQGKPVLSMDGPSVFRFALDRVKASCDGLLRKIGLPWNDIDLVLCHQANRFMLQALQRQFGLDDSRMPIDVEDIGNLSTASLPVHIARCIDAGKTTGVRHSLAVGFGVGLSWGATHITWHSPT